MLEKGAGERKMSRIREIVYDAATQATFRLINKHVTKAVNSHSKGETIERRYLMKVRKMFGRNKRRGRILQNVPHRRSIVNIRSSWSDYEYKTSREEIDMDIQELLKRTEETIRRSKEVNEKAKEGIRSAEETIKHLTLVEREELVKSWSRLFESQGMSRDEALKQARITVTQGGKGNLLDSLKLAGFTEAQANSFIKGRGGVDDLTDTYLASKKKELLESAK
jgi:hypothetical protein